MIDSEKFVRLMPYFSSEEIEKLTGSRVLVIGLGGVGGLVVESLARCSINNLGIVDGDVVEKSNFNRQVIAINDNIGLSKVDAMEKMIKSINDFANVKKYDFFVNNHTLDLLDINNYDLVLDCIDDVNAKIMIIEKCKKLGVEILSCMGTANKSDPTKFKVVDINQTSYCPLAKRVRSELRKKQISNVKVCFSDEVINSSRNLASMMFIVGSASFVICKYAIDYLILRD